MTDLLLIEDDQMVRTELAFAMRDEGHNTREAADGTSGLEMFEARTPDLVLLDVRLPDMSGFDVCRRLRAFSNVPIIMVTAQDNTHDLVAGLEAGADDYVVKPVEPKALAARIRALMRRAEMGQPVGADTTFGDLEVREAEGVVRVLGQPIGLTRTEFRLICEFANHPGQVLSREQLLDRVWGYDYFGDGRIVDAHIRRLRVKIEPTPDEPRFILTARGLGYRLNPEPGG